ncbi:MAG: hypothetical protein Kow0065_06480 [Methylomicrobium sp.]
MAINWHRAYQTWPAVYRYGLAVILFILALWIRQSLLPEYSGLAFVTFYPAILISFYLCGLVPGFGVALLSGLVGSYFFIQPHFGFSTELKDYIGVGFFALTSALIGYFITRLHHDATSLREAQAKLTRANAELEKRVETRSADLTAANARNQDIAKQLQTAVYAANVGLWEWDVQTQHVYFSTEWKTQLGYTDSEILNDFEEWRCRMHPDDLEPTLAALQQYIEHPKDYFEQEFRLRHKDGTYRWILAQASLIIDSEDKPWKMVGSHIDITESKRWQRQERARAKILEAIATATPLTDVLNAITQYIEQEIDGALASILLVDDTDGCLRLGTAPSLPEFYNQATDGLPIGNGIGSCGTAAHENRRVVVEDIQTHPFWQDYREVAAQAGLASCWAEPIRNGQNQVIGTFAIYQPTIGAPSATDLQSLDSACRLASIAIELDTSQRRLRDRQAQLQAAIHASRAGMWQWELETHRVMWSDMTWDLYDLQPDMFQPNFEAWRNTVVAEDLQRIEPVILDAVALHADFEVEWRVRGRPDHQPRWLLARGCPQPSTADKVTRYIGVVMDITERKQLELELAQHRTDHESLVVQRTAALRHAQRETETALNRFRQIFEESPIGIALIDSQNGQIREVNQRFADIAGRTRAEMTVIDWMSITHPDDIQADLDFMAKMNAGAIDGFQMNKRYLHPDGQIVWIDMTVAPLATGSDERPLHLCMISDITERIAAERALKEAEQTLRQAQAVAHIGSWHMTSPGDTFAISEETARLYDLGDADSTITFSDWFTRIHPDDRARVNAAWQAALQGAPYDVTCRIVRRGEILWIKAVAELEFDAAGQWVKGIGTVQDITESVTAAQRLEQLNRELAQRTEQAEAANRAKSSFLAMMSHEIRTPLNVILGLVNLFDTHDLSTAQQQDIQDIEIASKNLLALINDILDFSKIEAGELQLDSHPFRLNSILTDLQAMFGRVAIQKGLQFDITADTPELTLIGDEVRLRQILINLLSNAFKFTHQGQITVTGRLDAQRNDRGIQLHLTVADTGIGIAHDHLTELFAPFRQADISTTRHYGGTGLGLSIVKRLVELMGGQIHADSEIGKGSTFTLSLPFAVAGDQTVDGPDRRTETKPLSALRIMIVDDAEMNLRVAGRLLAGLGAQPTLYASAEEALAALRAQPDHYDSILMDMQMPVMDGCAATEYIRQKLRLTLPIIALTAGATTSERQRAKAAGMNDFLSKPIDPQRLVEVLLRHNLRDRAPIHSPLEPPLLPAAPVPTTTDTAQQSHAPSLDWPELAGIDNETVRRLLENDLDLFKTLLELFLTETEGVVSDIKQRMACGETGEAMKIAHKLRGQAANLGGIPLSKASAALETALNSSASDIEGKIEAVEQAYLELAKAGRTWLNTLN